MSRMSPTDSDAREQGECGIEDEGTPVVTEEQFEDVMSSVLDVLEALTRAQSVVPSSDDGSSGSDDFRIDEPLE